MQIGEHLAQVLWFRRHPSRQRYATRRRSVLQHLHERRSLFRRQLAQRLLRSLSVLVCRYGVGYFTVSRQDLLIGVALGRVSLFVSLNEIAVLFLALPTGTQLVKDSHVQHSFAHRSPPRRPYSNVKSMVLVAQFGATAVGGIRQEEWATPW